MIGKSFANWLLYKRLGWTKHIDQPIPPKYIICLAPHTSNWDFFYGQIYAMAEGTQHNFLMKKEWFFWPLGTWFRSLGGIPVERSRHTSLTDQLAAKAKEADRFSLCITPEGTRSANPDWKKGFYFIAQKAGIPILLYGLDFAAKRIVCTKTIIPSGNVEEDMMEIKQYFMQFKGKHPEKFVTGLEQ